MVTPALFPERICTVSVVAPGAGVLTTTPRKMYFVLCGFLAVGAACLWFGCFGFLFAWARPGAIAIDVPRAIVAAAILNALVMSLCSSVESAVEMRHLVGAAHRASLRVHRHGSPQPLRDLAEVVRIP